MHRPPVDIVVPFVGTEHDLAVLVDKLQSSVDVREGDTVIVADNRANAAGGSQLHGSVHVVGAAGRASSYYARNAGAQAGVNPWIVFIDADVEPPANLVDAYFDEAVADDVGILIGGIHDAPPGPSAVEQHAYRRGSLSHASTELDGGFTFAQTANVAVRRSAFEAVGGFRDSIRSGGDADLCFRIKGAGYRMIPRHEAAVVHQNRSTLKAFVRQYARYGSGGAWLDARYPGFSPRPRAHRVVLSLGAAGVRASGAAVRGRPLDAKLYLLDGVVKASYVAGRRWTNEVPAP